MQLNLDKDWSHEAFTTYLSDLEKTDAQKAEEFCTVLKDLHITLPSQVFDERYQGELSGLRYEIIHLGGTPPTCRWFGSPNRGSVCL
jgi:hypothetical protein